MNENRNKNERDDVARLVRLAGKRPTVPPERTERVRAAAHAAWQEQTRKRRTRGIWAAAALATAAILVLAVALRLIPSGVSAELVLTVEALTGEAWTRDGNGTARRTLAVGDAMPAGQEVATSENALAAMRLASGHAVRLNRNTRLRINDDGSLALDRGTLYVDSDGAHADGIDVHTPFGLIEEIGTQFEIRLDADSMTVRLREGAVVVHHDGTRHRVRAGTALEMDASGSVSTRTIPIHGAEWSWIAAVASTPDFEGRAARAFLDWVARERGWALVFADEQVARSAETIVLGGTVGRLPLDDVLDAVLPTCRMTYRVDDGVLTVMADTP